MARPSLPALHRPSREVGITLIIMVVLGGLMWGLLSILSGPSDGPAASAAPSGSTKPSAPPPTRCITGEIVPTTSPSPAPSDGSETEPVAIQGDPCAFVSGYLAGPDGEAIPGVRIATRMERSTGTMPAKTWYAATTDTQGRFSIGIPSGTGTWLALGETATLDARHDRVPVDDPLLYLGVQPNDKFPRFPSCEEANSASAQRAYLDLAADRRIVLWVTRCPFGSSEGEQVERFVAMASTVETGVVPEATAAPSALPNAVFEGLRRGARATFDPEARAPEVLTIKESGFDTGLLPWLFMGFTGFAVFGISTVWIMKRVVSIAKTNDPGPD